MSRIDFQLASLMLLLCILGCSETQKTENKQIQKDGIYTGSAQSGKVTSEPPTSRLSAAEDSVLSKQSQVGKVSEKQVKTMLGWARGEDGRDSALMVEKEFSVEGWLLKDNHPDYYCYISYKYNQRGRVVEKDLSCGETSANGGTTYEYSQNKICTSEYVAGYQRIACDSFNLDGIRIRRDEEFTDHMGVVSGDRVSSTVYFYYQELLMREEEKTVEYINSSHQVFKYKGADTLFSEDITFYTYDSMDSLIGYFMVEQSTMDTAYQSIWKYDPVIHRMIEKISYRHGDKTDVTTWNYDTKGRLIEKNDYDYIGNDSIPFSYDKYEYIYKTEALRMSRATHGFTDKQGISYIDEDYYTQGVLTKSLQLDDEGKISQQIKYYYTYW